PHRSTLVLDTRLDYAGYFRCAAHCRLRIFQHAGQTVALFTELDSNRGTSITNRIEVVCHMAVREYELDAERTVFVEHDPRRPRPLGTLRGESFDRVVFERQFWGHYEKPHWRRMTQADLEA